MTIEQLNLKYELIDRKRDYEVIDFFEQNSMFIQNLDESKDTDTLTTKTYLLSDYAYAVGHSGRNHKAIPLLREALKLHELHPNFESNKKESKGYEHLLFLLGQCLYQNLNIDEAKEVLMKLIQSDPSNKNYRSWLIEALNFKRKKASKYIFIAFTVWLLISVLSRSQVPKQVDLAFTILGLTLFIVWAWIDIVNYLTKRKYK